jgi:hypothetical protein
MKELPRLDQFPLGEIRPLAAPASYRQSVPASLPLPVVSATAKRSRRQWLVIGAAIAILFHLGVFLTWYLTPPLRLKASYAPERWVHILPVAKPVDPPTSTATPKTTPAESSSRPADPKSDRDARPPRQAPIFIQPVPEKP